MVGVGFLLLIVFGVIVSLFPKEERSTTTGASRPARAEPDPPPADTSDRRWEAFNRYGPTLGDIITRSDQADALIAAGAQLATARNRGELYNLTDRAAQVQGTLKNEALRLRVPEEARAFKDAVYQATVAREAAMNKQKDALDRPSAATEGALTQAKRDATGSVARVAVALIELCTGMEASLDECFPVVGIAAP